MASDGNLDDLFAKYVEALREVKTQDGISRTTKMVNFRAAASNLMKLDHVQERLVEAGYITVHKETGCWLLTEAAHAAKTIVKNK